MTSKWGLPLQLPISLLPGYGRQYLLRDISDAASRLERVWPCAATRVALPENKADPPGSLPGMTELTLDLPGLEQQGVHLPADLPFGPCQLPKSTIKCGI